MGKFIHCPHCNSELYLSGDNVEVGYIEVTGRDNANCNESKEEDYFDY